MGHALVVLVLAANATFLAAALKVYVRELARKIPCCEKLVAERLSDGVATATPALPGFIRARLPRTNNQHEGGDVELAGNSPPTQSSSVERVAGHGRGGEAISVALAVSVGAAAFAGSEVDSWDSRRQKMRRMKKSALKKKKKKKSGHKTKPSRDTSPHESSSAEKGADQVPTERLELRPNMSLF